MGDLVKDLRYGELTSTLERLGQRDIGVYHMERLRRYESILDEVARALKAPVVRAFPLEPIPNASHLEDLCRPLPRLYSKEVLIRDWESLRRAKLASSWRLKTLHLVEFGEPTSPDMAHHWMLANQLKPASIREVAIFAGNGLQAAYGVIGTASQEERGSQCYVPGYYKPRAAGMHHEVRQLLLDKPLDSNQWRYLAYPAED